jgi:hypothetical protein
MGTIHDMGYLVYIIYIPITDNSIDSPNDIPHVHPILWGGGTYYQGFLLGIIK